MKRRIPVYLSTRTCVDLSVADTLALANELGYDGVDVWVVHPGRLSSRADLPESYWPAQLEFYLAVFARAAELNVVASAEHMERGLKHIFGTPQDVARLRTAAGAAGAPFAYTLDVAQLLVGGDEREVRVLRDAAGRARRPGRTRRSPRSCAPRACAPPSAGRGSPVGRDSW